MEIFIIWRSNNGLQSTTEQEKDGRKYLFSNEQSKYTREDVADYLQLASPRVIYDWENGTKMPSTENLFNLAKLFKVQIEDILAI